MTAAFHLPNADQAARQLKLLLRRAVDVSVVPAPAKGALALAGQYRCDDGGVVGHCAADLAFAARAGAAFSLIPADAAADAIKQRALDDTLRENFAEVLNVVSRLFVPTQGQRVTLRETFLPPTAPPAEALPVAGTPGGVCFKVDIDGYGEGLLSLRLA